VIRRIFLGILAISLLELAIMVKLGMLIGFWPMTAIVFGIGAVGILLARSQGVRTLRALQADLAVGRMPAPRLLDQALILAGGILLVMPGLLSDLAGLALVIPPTRSLLKSWLRRRLARRLERSNQQGNPVEPVSYTVVIP
jgi:UPF0716 protein FxsA